MTEISYYIFIAATCTHSKVDVQNSVLSPNHSSRGVAESHKPSSLTVPHSWDPVSPGTMYTYKEKKDIKNIREALCDYFEAHKHIFQQCIIPTLSSHFSF